MSLGTHNKNPGYESKNNWVECQRCGVDRRANDIRREWTGLLVCRDTCWEPRHPQELVRAKKEKIVADVVNIPAEELCYGLLPDAAASLTWGTDKELQLREDALTAGRVISLVAADTDVEEPRFILDFKPEGETYAYSINGSYRQYSTPDAYITLSRPIFIPPAGVAWHAEFVYRDFAWALDDFTYF